MTELATWVPDRLDLDRPSAAREKARLNRAPLRCVVVYMICDPDRAGSLAGGGQRR